MGLTIYYNCSFNPKASLPEMIEEVKDIAETYGWKFHIFEKDFPAKSLGKKEFNKKVYGILFSPPECEPVILCFLSNGKMCNPFLFEQWLKEKIKKEEKYVFGNFTKTQYAGPDVHKIIINLFRYLSKKYFKRFTLSDEGKYWESNDEQLLRKTFKEWGALISGFADALQNLEKKKGESIEGAILRAAGKFHRRRKK